MVDDRDGGVLVDRSRRGQDIRIIPCNRGWEIKLDGKSNAFAGQYFTRFALAQVAVALWKAKHARSSDAYIKEEVIHGKVQD